MSVQRGRRTPHQRKKRWEKDPNRREHVNMYAGKGRVNSSENSDTDGKVISTYQRKQRMLADGTHPVYQEEKRKEPADNNSEETKVDPPLSQASETTENGEGVQDSPKSSNDNVFITHSYPKGGYVKYVKYAKGAELSPSHLRQCYLRAVFDDEQNEWKLQRVFEITAKKKTVPQDIPLEGLDEKKIEKLMNAWARAAYRISKRRYMRPLYESGRLKLTTSQGEGWFWANLQSPDR